MKKLLMVFAGLATITVGTPLAIAGLIYTPNADIPDHLYEEGISVEDEMYKEIGTAIESLGDDGLLDIGISEDTINKIIYASLMESYPESQYAPGDDCNDDACRYIFKQDIDDLAGQQGSVGLLGVWVDIFKDTFVLNIYVDGMGYRTNAQVYLNFYDREEHYEFKLDKVKLGNLPIPIEAMRDLGNFVLEQANSEFTLETLDQEIATEIENQNLPVEASINNLNVLIIKDEVATSLKETIIEDNNGSVEVGEFMYEIVTFIFGADLFSFGFFDGTEGNGYAGAQINLSQFKYDEVRDGVPTFKLDLDAVNTSLNALLDDNPAIRTSNESARKITLIKNTLIGGYDELDYSEKVEIDGMQLDTTSLNVTNINQVNGIIEDTLAATDLSLFKDGEEYDFETHITRTLYSSLDTLETGLFELLIDQDVLNRGVFTNDLIVEASQSFVYPDATTGELTKNATLGVEAVWVDFSQDTAEFKFLANLNGYKISGTAEFEILDKFDSSDSFEVSLIGISFGEFAIPNSLLSSGFRLGAADMNSADTYYIAPSDMYPGGALETEFGLVDFASGVDQVIKLTVTEDKIISLFEGDTSGAPIGDVFEIIFDNNLVNFSVDGSSGSNGQLSLSANVAKLQSSDITDIPLYLYDLHDENGYNPDLFDVEAYMQDRVMSFVFNQVIDQPQFILSEQVINKMFYNAMNGAQDLSTSTEEYYNGVEDKVAELGVEGLWFDLVDDGVNNYVIIYAFADFNGLPALIAVQTEVSYTNNGSYNTAMKLTFDQITIGADAGETPDEYLEIPVETLLNLVDDSFNNLPFGTYNSVEKSIEITALTLSNMIAEGTAGEGGTAPIEVLGITVENNKFVLDVGYTSAELQQTVEQFTAAVETVTTLFVEGGELNDELTTIFAPDPTDTPEEAAAKEQVQTVIENVAGALVSEDFSTIDTEQITEMFDNLSSLDAQTQEEFLTSLEENIDPALFEDFDLSILGNEATTGTGQ